MLCNGEIWRVMGDLLNEDKEDKMPSGVRLKRINDRIKQVLSLTLQGKMEDPRLNGVFVTEVNVDRELDYANIYISAVEGQSRAKEAIEALNHARGFLKYELSNEIDLRVMPKLRFYWDPTPEKADRIDTLLMQIRTADQEALDKEFDDQADEEFDDVG